MIATQGRKLFLKTFYEQGVETWGVLALARMQGAPAALGRYRDGDLVLVAQSARSIGEGKPSGRGGRIFAVCTLAAHRFGITRELANPDVLRRWGDDVHKWPECVAIDEYWLLRRPRYFRDFPSVHLSRRAGELRGKLGEIDAQSSLELGAWLRTAEVDPATVWRPRPRLAAAA
jgi:hypothetical protein